MWAFESEVKHEISCTDFWVLTAPNSAIAIVSRGVAISGVRGAQSNAICGAFFDPIGILGLRTVSP